jgi:hypothetical protein
MQEDARKAAWEVPEKGEHGTTMVPCGVELAPSS